MVTWKSLLPIGVSILMFVLIIGMLMYVNTKIRDAVNNSDVATVIDYGTDFVKNLGRMLLLVLIVATTLEDFRRGGL